MPVQSCPDVSRLDDSYLVYNSDFGLQRAGWSAPRHRLSSYGVGDEFDLIAVGIDEVGGVVVGSACMRMPVREQQSPAVVRPGPATDTLSKGARGSILGQRRCLIDFLVGPASAPQPEPSNNPLVSSGAVPVETVDPLQGPATARLCRVMVIIS